MDYRFIKGTSPRLLVFFHGTGGNKESLLFLHQQLDPEASVLSLDGSWGQGRERRFFASLIVGQLDLVDFEKRLSAFLDFWQDLDFQPYQQITFVGFSNGANFIMGLLAEGIEVVHQALLLHPSALSYSLPIISSQLPILVTAGRNDEMVDLEELENLCQTWKQHAFENLTLRQFNGGHFLTESEKEVLIQWYRDEKIT
ncbi:TPA: alpha/beta hydrolase [Streptococcus suis]